MHMYLYVNIFRYQHQRLMPQPWFYLLKVVCYLIAPFHNSQWSFYKQYLCMYVDYKTAYGSPLERVSLKSECDNM